MSQTVTVTRHLFIQFLRGGALYAPDCIPGKAEVNVEGSPFKARGYVFIKDNARYVRVYTSERGVMYIPPTKQKLIELLTTYYPDKRAQFCRMKKAQLYAIYFRKQKKYY